MSGGRGVRGNREVSPLRKRPRRQSRHGLFSDVASDVAVLSVRGGGRHAARAKATPKEAGSWGKHGFPHGSEPKARDAHASSPSSASTAATSDPSRTAPATRSM